jgi:hypothetical protein
MFSTIDSEFLFKLVLNTGSVSLLVFGCYMQLFTKNKVGNREHAISFLLFSVGVFCVTYLLHSVDISMGFAFGLFAVFSMLRYRTESISVKEMTYLFLVIAISLLSAVSSASLIELALLHGVFIVVSVVSEALFNVDSMSEKTIQYEKIENIVPAREGVLIKDLTERTGLNIKSVEVVHIDFLKDCADLIVSYAPNDYESQNTSQLDSSAVNIRVSN